MDEYVKRGDVMKAYEEEQRRNGSWRFEILIESIPSSDVAPIRHGRWERDEWGSYLRRCSVCKKSPIYKDERGNSVAVYAGVCINCGAKMYGDNNA